MIRLDTSPREYLEAIEQDSSWLPWLSRRTSLRQLRALWRELLALRTRLDSLEEKLSAVDDAIAQLDQATTEVASRLDALSQEVASLDGAAAAKITAEADKLRQLGADPSNPVPTTDPTAGGPAA